MRSVLRLDPAFAALLALMGICTVVGFFIGAYVEFVASLLCLVLALVQNRTLIRLTCVLSCVAIALLHSFSAIANCSALVTLGTLMILLQIAISSRAEAARKSRGDLPASSQDA